VVTPKIDAGTREALRHQEPPRHWAALEMPVVFESNTRELSYFEETPKWGALYWEIEREKLRSLLSWE
jgi:hypothetical protein